MTADKRIIIKCIPRPDFPQGMMFYCPFCEKWHLHGIGNGYRSPHCNQKSPLYERDYYIKMASKKELKEIRDAINAYLGVNK